MRDYGVGLECHGQNTLARFDHNCKLIGFAYRDFAGMLIHNQTLKSKGIEHEFHKESTLLTDSLDKVYELVFHAGIQGHLHRVIRRLNLHYNRKGWDIVKNELEMLLPSDHRCRKLWFRPTMYYKPFLIMREVDVDSDETHIHHVPNLLSAEARNC